MMKALGGYAELKKASQARWLWALQNVIKDEEEEAEKIKTVLTYIRDLFVACFTVPKDSADGSAKTGSNTIVNTEYERLIKEGIKED